MVLASDYIDWVVASAYAPSSDSHHATPTAHVVERRPRPELPERLKSAIAASHAAIEQVPVSRALASGRVTRDEYVALLRQIWPLHRAVEAAFASAPLLAGLYREETMARADAVAGDLAALGAPYTPLAIPEAVRELVRAATRSPGMLIGFLYVLEGSRMGSLVLLRTVARALNLPTEPGVGLDYHLDGSAGRPRTWQAWKASLAVLPLGDAEADDAVRGAETLMAALIEHYAAISIHEAERVS